LIADCHCHTHFSDGALSVSDLLARAKARNLTGLSITDHDTLSAYDTAFEHAKNNQIELIPGIEISSELNRTNIHVLGYAFDLKHAGLNEFINELHAARDERNEKILAKLEKLNMPISMNEVKSTFPVGIIARPHIAKMMITKGYVKDMKKAFDLYLGNKGRCYVSGCFVPLEKAIAVIQQAGGFAVIAHPHRITAKKVNELLEYPFDGIEVYYANTPLSETTRWLEVANKKNWLVTGGSDFHEENKYKLDLGSSFTPETTWQVFQQRILQHSKI
jgi:predicted metal-dependent phosphoesterase TrpH